MTFKKVLKIFVGVFLGYFVYDVVKSIAYELRNSNAEDPVDYDNDFDDFDFEEDLD